MDNLFVGMTDEKLARCYECDLDFKERGICDKEPLREILDKYCDSESPHAIVYMENDLLREIANRWYATQSVQSLKEVPDEVR